VRIGILLWSPNILQFDKMNSFQGVKREKVRKEESSRERERKRGRGFEWHFGWCKIRKISKSWKLLVLYPGYQYILVFWFFGDVEGFFRSFG
jgi:hypothetical protein